MTVIRRLAQEYVAQGIFIAVTLSDRVLVAAILLRIWGVTGFAGWALATSAASMLALFDFGLNFYFSNKLAHLVEQGEIERAGHAYRAGTFLVFCACILGLLCVAIGFSAYSWFAQPGTVTPELWTTTMLLLLGQGVRYAFSVQFFLYRAHQQLARQTLLLAGCELVRLVATMGAALLGSGVIGAASAYLAASVLSIVSIALIDTRRRFPRFKFGFALPHVGERKEAGAVSLAYWLQSALTTLLASGPILVIAATAAGSLAVAQFILVRTLTNAVRMVQQLMGVVLGQEAARRVAVDDSSGLERVFREGSLMLGVQSACIAGSLTALGRPLFALWTGNVELYAPLLLWVSLAPLAIAPNLLLGLNVFANANRPRPIVIGRIAQLAIALAGYCIIPIQSPGLCMLVSLSIAELIGLGVPVLTGIHRLIPGADLRLLVSVTARSLLAAAVSHLAVLAALRPFSNPAFGFAAGLLVAAFVGLVLSATLGVERERRLALMSAARSRLLGLVSR